MKTSQILSVLLIGSFSLFSCGNEEKTKEQEEEVIVDPNPAAADFDLFHSDQKAIDVADKVMKAMGGRENWDNTNILSWNFFGNRQHYWNKATGDIRIEIPQENVILLSNVNTLEGKAKVGETDYSTSDSLAYYMQLSKELWVNDSYWLFMPYKLKDSGVTLKYKQKKMMENQEYAHALELTFKDVGYTPNNKYMIYVDPIDKLVVRWDFFQDTLMDNPVFSTSWEDYQQYGNILLSSVRNEDTITNIKVLESTPEGFFTDFNVEL